MYIITSFLCISSPYYQKDSDSDIDNDNDRNIDINQVENQNMEEGSAHHTLEIYDK